MIEAFQRFLGLLDRCEQPLISYDDTQGWLSGSFDALLAQGLLRDCEPGTQVPCPGCDENHMLDVEIRRYPERTVGVAKCPDCGRVEVELDRLRVWEPHFDGLAAALAAGLGFSGGPTLLTPGRISLLGAVMKPSGTLDVFLARGLSWEDSDPVIKQTERLQTAQTPVVIVPRRQPPEALRFNVRPTILTLAEHVRWDAEASRLDFSALAAAIRQLLPPVAEERWLTVTEGAKLLMDSVDGLDLRKARARVSWAARKGKFRTNGKTRTALRIDRDSFSTWLNEQRERDLARADGCPPGSARHRPAARAQPDPCPPGRR